MTLQATTVSVEKDATLMASPDIKYVSLVRHAANREPFRVIKSDSGGVDDMAINAVQRIIAPQGTDILAVLKEEGIEFDGELSVATKSEVNGFDVYIQTGLENFVPESLCLRKLASKGDKNIFALMGQKLDDSEPSLKCKSNLQSPLADVAVKTSVTDTYSGFYVSYTTAEEALDDELWNMYRAIGSIGSAAGMDNKSRLKAILALLDGFKNFITDLIALTDTQTTTKSEDGICHTSNFPKLMGIISSTKIKNEDMDMNHDAIIASIQAGFATVMEARTKAETDSAVQELKAELETLKAAVASITEEKESLAKKAEEATAALAAVTEAKAELERKMEEAASQVPAPSNPPVKDTFFDSALSVVHDRTKSEGKKKTADFSVFNSMFNKPEE